MESAHQLSFRPDCNSTTELPSFTLRTALSAIPFVSDQCGVDVQWFQERSSQAFPNSEELSVYMTSGFLFGSKNFCKFLRVSWEVFVLTGYDWIHWVAKSCTTTAYRWSFRDSHPSLRTSWSAVINQITKIFCTRYGSANASSARGCCNFCPRSRIFGLQENEFSHWVYPNPHFS